MNPSPDTAIQRIQTQSITGRLTAALLTTIIVVSAVAITAMQQVLSRAETRALEQKADEALSYLIGALEIPLWSVDDDGAKTVGRAVSRNESIVWVIIRNESGAIVYSSRSESGEQERELTIRSGKIFHRQWGLENFVGDVSVSLAPTIYRESAQRSLRYSAFIIVLILISVAVVTVVCFRASLSRPLKSLDEIASRFARGIYDNSGHALPFLEFQPFGKTLAHMAEKIEEQIRLIKESEAKYRRIVDTATEGIWMLGPDTLTTFVNARMAEMLGYPGEEMIGRPTTDFMFDEEVPDHLKRMENRRQGLSENYERRFRRKNGETLWTLVSAAPILDEKQQSKGAFAMFTDITDRKQAEEEVGKLNQQLEQRVVELQAANRELETMTYSVSHDLRQPLRTIDGFLGLLKRRIGATLDDEGRRQVMTISEAALRMARLIDALLTFSRSGRFEMNRVPVDLKTLAGEVARELESAALGRAVEWRIGELPVVRADHAMLRVVFGNLLSNALKFTQPRPRAEIEVGCLEGQGNELIVFVRDNGVGFDMQYAHKLFRVFERLHGLEEFEGIGIGLANVRRIISRHGGSTWAEGKMDGGATFFFSLPRQATN